VKSIYRQVSDTEHTDKKSKLIKEGLQTCGYCPSSMNTDELKEAVKIIRRTKKYGDYSFGQIWKKEEWLKIHLDTTKNEWEFAMIKRKPLKVDEEKCLEAMVELSRKKAKLSPTEIGEMAMPQDLLSAPSAWAHPRLSRLVKKEIICTDYSGRYWLKEKKDPGLVKISYRTKAGYRREKSCAPVDLEMEFRKLYNRKIEASAFYKGALVGSINKVMKTKIHKWYININADLIEKLLNSQACK